MRLPLLALLAGLCLAIACRLPGSGGGDSDPRHDIHSAAEPEAVRVTHLDLDLELDFEARMARGKVRLSLRRILPNARLVLDTHGLEIGRISGQRGPLGHQTGSEVGRLGRRLVIALEPYDEWVEIEYTTRPDAEALQWLSPNQTAGGKQPFLFTQGQAILTRSWIPCQDTPGVRMTYDARIRAPEPLTVVMAAESRGRDADGAWLFTMRNPVPSYLIALAAGQLTSRDISTRCRVWAEPPLVEAARHEFADTEEMIRTAEGLFGPYRWGRYDLIVLPPAFPYGGMENPMLSFVTPTVLAGDRSLTSLVAHELAHSWSGNLVTNATWRDFWLNEGFTVYFEKRIVESVYGDERARMEMVLDRVDLERTIARLEPYQTVLHIDLTGHHPDDGFSSVPYEKGALFVRRLEEIVGRRALDAFLTGWFDEHAFTSVTTPDFEAYLRAKLYPQRPQLETDLDLDEWLRAPGLPSDAPRYESPSLARVDAELVRLAAGTAPEQLATEGWVTAQWLRFLDGLPRGLDAPAMGALDGAFGFTSTGNAEILTVWLERCVRAGYAPADQRLEDFLAHVGRRKYLMPLYEALEETDSARARAVYSRNRPRYHAVSRESLDAYFAPR